MFFQTSAVKLSNLDVLNFKLNGQTFSFEISGLLLVSIVMKSSNCRYFFNKMANKSQECGHMFALTFSTMNRLAVNVLAEVQCIAYRLTVHCTWAHSALHTGSQCIVLGLAVHCIQAHSALYSGSQCIAYRLTVHCTRARSALHTGSPCIVLGLAVHCIQAHSALYSGSQYSYSAWTVGLHMVCTETVDGSKKQCNNEIMTVDYTQNLQQFKLEAFNY